MASGLTLDIGANTREVVRGARDTAEAIEGISDALDPLARDGDKVGEEIADGLKDGRREVDKLETSFKDMARAAKREGDNAGDAIGKNVSSGADRAKDGISEIGDEAGSTAKEAAASFDGSAESIGDAFQEVAANAFAGFGPAGLVAGAAAAVGFGLVTAEMQKQQEETDALKERFAGLYQEAIESGRSYIDEAQILAGVQDLMFNTDRADEYKQALEDSKVLSLDIGVIARARSGDEDAVNQVLERRNTVFEEGYRTTATNDEALNTQYQRQDEALRRIEDQYGAIGTELDTNSKKAQQYADIEDASARNERSNISRAQGADAARYQALADRINGLPNKTVNVAVSTAQANRDLDAFIAKQRSIGVNVRVAGYNSQGGITR